MTIAGCGATSNIVTSIKFKPKNTYRANYYTPLTDRVEDPETPQPPTDALFTLNHVGLHQNQPLQSHFSGKIITATHNRLVNQPEAKTTIYYTATEINTFKNVSKAKGHKHLQPHPDWKMAQQLIMLKTPKQELAKPLTEQHLKEGVLNGAIPSEAWDTACTSNVGRIGDPIIQTDEPSKKIFALVDEYPAAGSNFAKLYHNVRDPACTVDMVPALA